MAIQCGAQRPRSLGGQGAARAAINVQGIASLHLFGMAAVNANSQIPARVPPGGAHLSLAGTIAAVIWKLWCCSDNCRLCARPACAPELPG